MEPGSSSVADYDIHSLAPGQFSPKDSNSSGEVKSSGNSFPLPTILLQGNLQRFLSWQWHKQQGEATGCSQRENSALLSGSLFCQFIKAWAWRAEKKISNFLLVRMPILFAIDVYVAGVQSNKKTSETLSLFLLKKNPKQNNPQHPNLLN